MEKNIDNNITYQDIAGETIVGYRYGEAPESGRSWNTRENCYEPGVSMASVGYLEEIRSFAVEAYGGEDIHYYRGRVVAETGGDDEICLEDVEEITREEYETLLPRYRETSDRLANAGYNRSYRVACMGYDINLESKARKRDEALTRSRENTPVR